MGTHERERILIVDDDVDLRAALRLALASDTRLIFEAGDGEEALSVAHQEAPDVVFTDLRMPQMDGHTLVRRLARSNPDAAVVVLSASDDPEDILDAMRAGAVDFVVKPAGVADIFAALQRAGAKRDVMASKRVAPGDIGALGAVAAQARAAHFAAQARTTRTPAPSVLSSSSSLSSSIAAEQARASAARAIAANLGAAAGFTGERAAAVEVNAAPEAATRKTSSRDALVALIRGGSVSLPKAPAVLTRLRTLIAAPDPSLADIATLVEREPAVAARTLRLANSAQQTARSGAITGIHAAVARIGLRQLKHLVEAVFLSQGSRATSAAGQALQGRIWRTSVARAEVMRALLEVMERGAPMLPEPAYAAGFFADAGALFMVSLCTEEELVKEAEVVRHEIAAHHERVGAELLRAWGLTSLDAAVAAAHHVTSAADANEIEHSPSECFLALASSLAAEIVGPDYTELAPPGRNVIDSCAAALNIGTAAAAAAVEKVGARLAEVHTQFQLCE